MADIGHVKTDKILSDLEKKIHATYKQAYDEMSIKVTKRLKAYEDKLAKKQADLSAGKITNAEFSTWKKNQVHMIINQQDLVDTLANDLTNTDEIAAAMINGHTPSVYALNYNFGTYQVEDQIKNSTSFALYNHNTVEILLKEDPKLLPKPKVDVPKDLAWNKKHISSAITQGVLQGESIPKIAERLQNAVGMSDRSAIRNARTATTGAQNMGRVSAYQRAKDMGIDLKQQWLATLDNRTRHSHRQMDGQIINMGEEFDNGCRYPGDPEGPGYEVYNCRCTLVPVIKGFERPDDWRQTESYAAWKGSKSFDQWEDEQAAPNANVVSIWSGKKMSQIYNLIKEQNTTDANKFYKELGKLGKPSEVWDKYLKSELDADDITKFENILTKYLPANDTLDSHDLFLADLKKKNPMDLDYNQYKEAVKLMSSHGYGNMNDFWKDYTDGKIKDSDFDTVLGYKKAADKTAKIIDNVADGIDDLEKQLKFTKGDPMTMEKADKWKVNPFYDKGLDSSTINCQTCTFTYECRRQGYDVIALPKDKDLGDIFDLQSKLGHDQANGWINKVTGKKPEALVSYYGEKPGEDMLKKLEEIIGKDGERYTLGVSWKADGAHSINIDRDEKGLLRIIDNQRGPNEKNVWVGKEVEDYFKDVKRIRSVYRVDNCIPNPEYFNKIVVSADNKIKSLLPFTATKVDPKLYVKLNAHVKKNYPGEKFIYKKWKYGAIDDDELDKLFNIKKITADADDALDAYKKSLPNNWLGLKDMLNDDDLYQQIHKIVDMNMPNSASKGEYLKKYIIGQIDDSDLDKIFKDLMNGSAKTDDIANDIFDKSIVSSNWGEVTNYLMSADYDAYHEIMDELQKLVDEKHPMKKMVLKGYKNGEIQSDKLDELFAKAYGKKLPEKADNTFDAFFNFAKKEFQGVEWSKSTNGTAWDKFSKDAKDALSHELYNLKKLNDFDTKDDVLNAYFEGKLKSDNLDNIFKEFYKDQLSEVTDTIPKADNKLDFLKKKFSVDDIDDVAGELWKDLDAFTIAKEAKKSTGHKAVYDYFKDYVNGDIDNPDLDKLLGITFKTPAPATKTIDAIDYSKYGGKDVYDILSKYNDFDDFITAPANEFDKVTTALGNDSDKIQKAIKEIKSDKVAPSITPNTPNVPIAGEKVVDLDVLKNKKVTAVYNEIKADMSSKDANAFYNELKKIGAPNGEKQGDVWNKYLKGELSDEDKAKIDKHLINKYNKIVEPPKPTEPEVNYGILLNKKMSQVYNELKADNTSVANKFYNELKKHGKPSDVYVKYVNGELPEDVQKKIDSYLINKYQKAGTGIKGIDDISVLKNNLSSYTWADVPSLLDNSEFIEIYNIVDKNKGGIKFADYWKKYLAGEVKNKDLDDFITKNKSKLPTQVKPKIAPSASKATPVTPAAPKVDDAALKAAQDKLKKAEDDLKKVSNPTYKGIWKDDVTLADYETKKGTIAAKKIYYDEELDKLLNDPSYKSWLSDADKQQKIQDLQKMKNDLEDFEVAGKEYAKLQKAVKDAQDEVTKLSPGPFSPNGYSKERKDAAVYIKGSPAKIRAEANKLFAAKSRKEFNSAKASESEAIKHYTQSYHKFNEPLRGIQYGTSQYKGVGKVDLNAGSANNGKRLNAMTDYLEKCINEHDIWMQRGCGWGGMDKFLQCDMSLLQSGSEQELRSALLGKTVTEYGFMSCGTGRGSGFSGNILFNVFAPKGTKMSYAEVYSHYKNGTEIETILQQGTQFRITRVDKKGSQIYIDIEVINQLPPQRWKP